jgi:drug/metabolite transporter (DMT)-like permease
VPLPSFDQLWSVSPQIAYLAIPGAFLAVLFWNAAIGMIGAQNAVLFGNLIPITTFAIEIGRGYRPGAVEIAGAALTITAVIANNLLTRRPQAIDAGDQVRGRDTELAETARARANASPRAS